MSAQHVEPLADGDATPGGGAMHKARSLAYTQHGGYVIISPNAGFVPEPHVGLVKVHLCKDMRYGVYDPIQWPQNFCEELDYLCAVRRRDNVAELVYPRIWDTPDEVHDFVLLEGTIFKSLGLLSPTWLSPLEVLVEELAKEIDDFAGATETRLLQLRLTMLDARDRIIHFPSTYRDACLQLRTVQRYWLMCRAYLEFARLTGSTETRVESWGDTRFMGAFTTDPAVVQRLSRAGIPVWFIRPEVNISDTTVDAVVTTEQPVIISEAFEHGAAPIYSGLVGKAHLFAVSRRAHLYLDVSRVPLLVRYDTETLRVGPASGSARQNDAQDQRISAGLHTTARPTTATRGRRLGHAPYHIPHPSQVRGRDKFVDPVHSWMPAALPAWESAMKSVDRSAPAKRQEDLWGYWIPEPALLLGPQNVERTRRYLMNWLRIRAPWLYLLSHPEARVTRVQPQWWRDYLNGDMANQNAKDGTRRSKRLEQIKDVFHVALDMQQYVPSPDRPVHWFTFRISDPSPTLSPFVIWEVHEIGFRYELIALDRLLVPLRDVENGEALREELLSRVFPDYDLYYVRNLPENPRGLCAELPHARVRCLEGFRQVLMRWPLCPQAVHATEPLALTTAAAHIVAVEAAMTAFYVHTFFAYSGRAPIVPHALPPFRAF